MPWSKLDDRLHENPKIGALSDKAFRLYILSITYSSSRLTRGKISVIESKMVCRLAGATEDTVKELVDLRAWDECPEGYCIHDYEVYNPDAETISQKRAEAGRKGAEARWQNSKTMANAIDVDSKPIANAWQTDGKGSPVPVPVPESRTRVNVNVKDTCAQKTRAAPSARFVPPTPNEIIDFFVQHGSSKKDAGVYFNHYVANGWMVGKNKMRDWRAAARGWIERGPLNGKGPPGGRTLEDMKAESIASLERLGYGD